MHGYNGIKRRYMCNVCIHIFNHLGFIDELPDLMESFEPSKISTPKQFKPSKPIAKKGTCMHVYAPVTSCVCTLYVAVVMYVYVFIF